MSEMTHEQYAASLRRIADWIEGHPEIPLPETNALQVAQLNTKDEAAQLATAFGSCEKVYDSLFFKLVKDFGGVKLVGLFYRSEICERVVVGTEHVEATMRPAELIPAHEREIVEWRCPDALLATATKESDAQTS